MSIDKLSPNMRNCIMSLQAESVVNLEYKAYNKNNTGSFIKVLKRLFK